MKKNNKKNVVYSTNPDFHYEFDNEMEEERLPNHQQNLKVYRDRKNRAGKTVTVVSGFVGSKEDRKELEKELKSLCGSGGSVKDGEILLQGDFIQKISEHLKKEGYKIKVSGI